MGNFYIESGSNFSLSADGVKSEDISYDIIDNCFKINYAPDISLVNLDFLTKDYDDAQVFLTVPAKVYESVKISVSAGVFTANSMEANNFALNFTAGDAYFYNVSAQDSADIKVSAGECYFDGSIFRNANLKMTAGQMNFENAKLLGSSNINLTAGELYMGLLGKRSDYGNININKTAGEVIINGMNMGEFEYSATAAPVETLITETLITATGDSEYTETKETSQETADIHSETGGTININLTAGECYIDFYEDNN